MHGLCRYLDRKLVRWAQRKYKTLRRHKRRWGWLHKMKKAYPRQFAHWQYQGYRLDNGLCHERVCILNAMLCSRCCARDGGGPSEVGLQELTSNSRKPLHSETLRW
jgi:hypothetical protein